MARTHVITLTPRQARALFSAALVRAEEFDSWAGPDDGAPYPQAERNALAGAIMELNRTLASRAGG